MRYCCHDSVPFSFVSVILKHSRIHSNMPDYIVLISIISHRTYTCIILSLFIFTNVIWGVDQLYLVWAPYSLHIIKNCIEDGEFVLSFFRFFVLIFRDARVEFGMQCATTLHTITNTCKRRDCRCQESWSWSRSCIYQKSSYFSNIIILTPQFKQLQMDFILIHTEIIFFFFTKIENLVFSHRFFIWQQTDERYHIRYSQCMRVKFIVIVVAVAVVVLQIIRYFQEASST